MFNRLEIIFEFSCFTCGYVFLDLDSFVVAEFGVDYFYVALVLDEFYYLLLFCLVPIMWINKLNIVPLIYKEKLILQIGFLLFICDVKQNILNLNFLIE